MEQTVPNLVERRLIRSKCMPALLYVLEACPCIIRAEAMVGVWGTKPPQPKDLTKLHFVLLANVKSL